MAAVAGRPASGGAGEAQASPTAATEATIREAQAELERAVVKAGLTNDPIRYLLEATSGALGAFLVGRVRPRLLMGVVGVVLTLTSGWSIWLAIR